MQVDSSNEVVDGFYNNLESLALDDDIDGIFFFINSKSNNNKSVYVLGEIELDVLAKIIIEHLKLQREENLN